MAAAGALLPRPVLLLVLKDNHCLHTPSQAAWEGPPASQRERPIAARARLPAFPPTCSLAWEGG